MQIQNIRHDFPKGAGYTLDRPTGRKHYTFAHYYSPVTLKLGNITYRTKAGACVFIEPDVPQYLYSEGPLIHNWIHFFAEPEELTERYHFPLNEPFYTHHSELISEKFRKIEAEFFSHEPHRELLLEAYVNEFFIWLYRLLNSPAASVTVPKAVEAAMSVVRKRVLGQPERNWTIAQMAEMVPLSTSRFHAVYKAMFGTTPTQDLIDSRIENAKNLLRTKPDISMKEAAECLGYSDQYSFIRQFKAITGQTPGTYRKAKK